jgi:hypothetical protein
MLLDDIKKASLVRRLRWGTVCLLLIAMGVFSINLMVLVGAEAADVAANKERIKINALFLLALSFFLIVFTTPD